MIIHNKPLEKRLARNEIEAAVLEIKQKPPQHPLTFCDAMEYCKYSTTNCLYGNKNCWYER